MTDIVTIYSDGSFRRPNCGAYTFHMTWNGITLIAYEGVFDTTINRMELSAVIEALEMLIRPCTVNIFSDSQYVVNTIAKRWIHAWKARGWKTASGDPVKNQDLMERLYEQLAIHTINATWVKGHSNVPENELCDSIAQGITQQMLNGR